MATSQGGVTVDTSQLKRVSVALAKAEHAVADDATGRLRGAAGIASAALLRELQSSAAGSPTPQARLVASTMTIRRDTQVGVKIGGGQRVGHRQTPAGALLWGSEHGGVNFTQPPGGRYWIEPAVAAFESGQAEQIYQAAVSGILKDAGLL